MGLPGASEPPEEQADSTGVRPDGQRFMNPHDVCLDADKNLYVPQWYSGRTYPIRLRRV